ncbi:hypothetical protein [Sinorhizobium meliloti]|uniref:hypothetical protein n=1 Tax=Rhizobium meliloti TaxID=382 RepID=UPI0013E3442E|nr:hypothetical protein [Sinorhizobium meliloti]
MDDSEAKSAGPIEPASDLSKIAAHCAASDLLDLAAQLAGLAEDLKALAARPIEHRGNPDRTRRRSLKQVACGSFTDAESHAS